MRVRHLTIGLLGCGNIGSGLVRILADSRTEEWLRRFDIRLSIRKALVRDLSKSRSAEIELTTVPEEVLDDPKVDVIVEVMGGVQPALDYALWTLSNGKHFVTSNKAVVASSYPELSQAARRAERHFLFEASVGGAVPIIRTLLGSPKRPARVEAVLNGTTNLILSLVEDGMGFADALAEAKDRGFTEQDPTDDLDGTDAAYKLCILGVVGFDEYVHPAEIPHTGIQGLTAAEIRGVLKNGQRYKLIARAAKVARGLYLIVQPELLSADSFLGRTQGAQNCFLISDGIGESALIGEGAGALPTGSSLLDDIVWLAKHAH